MASFRFADILLTLVVLLITFAILYLVERGRKQARNRKDLAKEQAQHQADRSGKKEHTKH